MAYDCNLCEGEEQATFLVTPLTGGDTMAVGRGCAPITLCGLFASYLGVDADKLWAAADKLVKAAQRAAAKAAESGGEPPPGGPPAGGQAEHESGRQKAGAES